MLQRRGFHVISAKDGASAFELFRQIKFHAVILDYGLPAMSGGEVARLLRGENPAIPIILHTGYKEIHDPLLEHVTCTLPKGSLAFLITKLNDVLQLPQTAAGQPEELAESENASANVA
jgi:CheY-like chemotaxis protein